MLNFPSNPPIKINFSVRRIKTSIAKDELDADISPTVRKKKVKVPHHAIHFSVPKRRVLTIFPSSPYANQAKSAASISGSSNKLLLRPSSAARGEKSFLRIPKEDK